MKLGLDMKDKKLMEWEMEKVNFIIKMEVITKANGKIIKCMVGENFSIKEEG